MQNQISRLWMSVLLTVSCQVASVELQGELVLENRHFFHSPGDREQQMLVLAPEFYHAIGNSTDLVVTPYVRFDSLDGSRNLWDIRELLLTHQWDNFEFRAGVSSVFWGVTESQHLVDVINQTDVLSDLDGEDKLGQPMLQLTQMNDWGNLEFFVLPYFRKRDLAGLSGRFVMDVPIVDRDEFESSAEERHLDWAVRYTHSFSYFDLGLSYFEGTNREPAFIADDEGLIPFYGQMKQVGMDVQGTFEALLLKSEVIYRKDKREDFFATTTGLEYSFFGVADSEYDLGLLLEYSYDQRKETAMTNLQNDVFAGVRLVLNDVNSSELLVGMFRDLSDQSNNFRLEASTRISSHWKLGVDAWVIDSRRISDPFYPIISDDFIKLYLEYHF